MSTATKSLTLLELLSSDHLEGKKAKITTDNNLYGTTVVIKKGVLINDRTNERMPLTSEIMQSKFKLIEEQAQLTLHGLISAYKSGTTIKIVVGDTHRLIRKRKTPELDELLKAISGVMPFGEVRTDSDIITLEELEHGKFFIVE